jgi:hypothetical protein
MRMNWLLPTPVLLAADVVALVPLASLLHQSVSLPPVIAEAFAINGSLDFLNVIRDLLQEERGP